MNFEMQKVSPRISEIGFYRAGNRGEEELVSHIDDDDPEYIKRGHKCLLSVEPTALEDYQTVYHDDYRRHWHDKKKLGLREDLMERFVYDKVMRESERKKRFQTPPTELNYTSETHAKFNANGFKSQSESPNKLEMPVASKWITFWNENYKSIPKTKIGNDKSLKRNSNFSKPIQERLAEQFM